MQEHSTVQRAFAEAIGTALLVFVGAGSVPAILLLEGGSKAPFSGADKDEQRGADRFGKCALDRRVLLHRNLLCQRPAAALHGPHCPTPDRYSTLSNTVRRKLTRPGSPVKGRI